MKIIESSIYAETYYRTVTVELENGDQVYLTISESWDDNMATLSVHIEIVETNSETELSEEKRVEVIAFVEKQREGGLLKK